uniref:Adenylosuccinate lyase n=1 Tax=Panagrellus redivivus TaxID=6233 RepID=A0A7E4ZQN7_PANRE
MASKYENYESPLTARYCRGTVISKTFSEQNKIETWRQLWIWLAEAEFELGLKQVTQEAIDELKANQKNIDFAEAAAQEKRLKHDVMAHNYTFGKICPKAAGIIHLGATSCYVQDNADLLLQKQALIHILSKLAICLKKLAAFAEKHAATVTVGRTHYQAASFTTIGKRAVIWAQELLMAFVEIKSSLDGLRFRGIKGATGTQDSFMTLFDEDEAKVERLDELVTEKAGFTRKFNISGQTYSRQQDSKLVFGLSNLGSAMKKVAHDIRILQAFDELREPFEAEQIGSSAMPYKRNPMKCERICGISTALINQVGGALTVLADQGLERTLDDSSARRVIIPDSFLLAEAALTTLQNVFEGLIVQSDVVQRSVDRELPFLALEEALMRLCEKGGDRQAAHHKIREVALSARQRLTDGEVVNIEDMISDPFFDKVRADVLKVAEHPINFAGRSESQVLRFIEDELNPTVTEFLPASWSAEATLDV